MVESNKSECAPSVADALAGVGLCSPLTTDERALLESLRGKPLPSHVAIIMDGNGRWAKQAGFTERIKGHEAGVESVRRVVRACGELHLKALTLYAFSSENWKRPAREVNFLMSTLEKFLKDEIDELNTGNVRLNAIGQLERLPEAVRSALDGAKAATAGNTGLLLNLALSYGGRDELTAAARAIAERVKRGELESTDIDETTVADALYTAGQPDPDLLIRTSGEMRISNFLLWQIAYTEFYVTPVLWPDFGRKDLYEALVQYAARNRRFGGIN